MTSNHTDNSRSRDTNNGEANGSSGTAGRNSNSNNKTSTPVCTVSLFLGPTGEDYLLMKTNTTCKEDQRGKKIDDNQETSPSGEPQQEALLLSPTLPRTIFSTILGEGKRTAYGAHLERLVYANDSEYYARGRVIHKNNNQEDDEFHHWWGQGLPETVKQAIAEQVRDLGRDDFELQLGYYENKTESFVLWWFDGCGQFQFRWHNLPDSLEGRLLQIIEAQQQRPLPNDATNSNEESLLIRLFGDGGYVISDPWLGFTISPDRRGRRPHTARPDGASLEDVWASLLQLNRSNQSTRIPRLALAGDGAWVAYGGAVVRASSDILDELESEIRVAQAVSPVWVEVVPAPEDPATTRMPSGTSNSRRTTRNAAEGESASRNGTASNRTTRFGSVVVREYAFDTVDAFEQQRGRSSRSNEPRNQGKPRRQRSLSPGRWLRRNRQEEEPTKPDGSSSSGRSRSPSGGRRSSSTRGRRSSSANGRRSSSSDRRSSSWLKWPLRRAPS